MEMTFCPLNNHQSTSNGRPYTMEEDSSKDTTPSGHSDIRWYYDTLSTRSLCIPPRLRNTFPQTRNFFHTLPKGSPLLQIRLSFFLTLGLFTRPPLVLSQQQYTHRCPSSHIDLSTFIVLTVLFVLVRPIHGIALPQISPQLKP